MSLQYEKETENAETPQEQAEELQMAKPVTPYYSIIIIVCLFAVAVCQIIADGKGGSLLLGGEESILLAGFDKPVFVSGQYWRILTGAVLHGGLLHLLMNCYALYVLGKNIEVLSNRAHLAIVFLLSALGGGLLSLIFMPGGRSVGASGGIIGFLGYLAVYGYLRRAVLSTEFLKNMLFNIGFIALYGIFLYQVVDNFGHFGGLLTGAIYGFFQIPRDVYKDPREAGSVTEIFGLVSLGIVVAAAVFSILILLRII
jgi:membrane associated rhomboid family serine protease